MMNLRFRWRRMMARISLGALAAWLLAFGAYGLAPESKKGSKAETPEKGELAAGRVALIQIKGGIFAGTEEFFLDALQRAEENHYECLVVELDTPGGGLDNTQEMVKAMLNAKIPVVVFVTPKGAQAASAGTFITMAGHIAAMAPGTRLGAAHPIFYSPLGGFPDSSGDSPEEKEKNKKKQEDQQAIMLEKVTNDTVMFIVGIAKERGRNAEWAEKAVRQSVSLTSDEAQKQNVIDLVAENLDDLLAQIHGRKISLDAKTSVTLKTQGATVDRWEMNLKQKLFGFLSNPSIFYLLLLLGIGGIAMEFYHPGAIFPGAIGALGLLLAAISGQILPLSWGGLILVLVGIGLLVAEVYVNAYGLLGIGGGILMVFGGIFLFDPKKEPYYQPANLQVEWSVLIPMVLVLVALFLYIGYFIVRSQRKRIATGNEGMQGLVGEARSEINPQGGRMFVRGEHWQAKSEEIIPSGSKVEVIRIEGLLLYVKKVS